jgi:hypothetical protein
MPGTLRLDPRTNNDTGWKDRHNAALTYPVGMERPIMALIDGIHAYCVEYELAGNDLPMDYVLGSGIGQLCDGVAALLDGPTGRLDCGTVSQYLYDLACSVGYDMETQEWFGTWHERL